MKRKLLNSKGMTLVEVLLAVALLALFGSMAMVGTSALFRSDRDLMDFSKAAVLGSDVMKIISNEIRFGEDFEIGESGNELNYSGASYGEGCTLKIGEGENEGRLVICKTSPSTPPSTTNFLPVGAVAYGNLKLLSVTFTIDEGGNISFTVSITSDGEKILWEQTGNAVPLNHKV